MGSESSASLLPSRHSGGIGTSSQRHSHMSSSSSSIRLSHRPLPSSVIPMQSSISNTYNGQLSHGGDYSENKDQYDNDQYDNDGDGEMDHNNTNDYDGTFEGNEDGRLYSEVNTNNKEENKLNSNEDMETGHNIQETTNASTVQKISLTTTTKTLKPSKAALARKVAASDTSLGGMKPLVDKIGSYMDEIKHDSNKSDLDIMLGYVGSDANSGLDTSTTNNTTLDPTWWLQKKVFKQKSKKIPVSADGVSNTNPPDEVPSEDIPEDYIALYWLDATEVNGVVYLFGKVAINEPGATRRFVSCCVAVHGCERNLFVLPKVVDPDVYNSDGTQTRASMANVYAEVNKLLVPSIIPKSEGTGFRCKGVLRSYAFEAGDVPRYKTQYLKVKYSAVHPNPTLQQCSQFHSKSNIQHIFGSSSSVLELFLLKRRLSGPSWIIIKKPALLPNSVSWCKLELGVADPKLVVKMSEDDNLPSPPLVSMCISMKTAVNPTSHQHEVIAISAFTHMKVDADADTELNSHFIRRFTLIRPLGNTCGNNYPPNFPHDLSKEMSKVEGGTIASCANERALLNLFLTKLHQEDPDVLISHNLFGFEFDVLLTRAIASKITTWNKIGRLRRTVVPKTIGDKDVASGRILCDTYKAAKEFLRETTYSLSALSSSQLNFERIEIDPIDIPRYYSQSSDIIKLASHTSYDAFLVQKLVLKLQVIPLTKQLTNLSGNLWSRTMKGARAERIEYLLLHEFYKLKYVLPERKPFEKKIGNSGTKMAMGQDEEDDVDGTGKVGGHGRQRAKASYAGGLVLEPKKGLYDSFILLLDFNSLYPSLIQEYNLCFTTINWTVYEPNKILTLSDTSTTNTSSTSAVTGKTSKKNKKKDTKNSSNTLNGNSDKPALNAIPDNEDDDDDEDEDNPDGNAGDTGANLLPPIPDVALPQGVLPRVIKTLVDRRREVKNILKNTKDVAARQLLDIRQKALKLTANSMYGCLGFTFSRFYARPIAALVTAKGREALQRTVDQATNSMGLDVIYGDTDSVMINTNSTDLDAVKKIGVQVTKEVNKLYKSLELDIDGIFKSMLLLKKKKYAALSIKETSEGIVLEKELKGLDLVRRDWCPLSKNTGKYVVDKILSGLPRDDIILAIHEYLKELAVNMRSNKIDIEQYVITKGLNKNPKDYPDAKGQAHLQVALKLLKENKPVNIGDHIPYIICNPPVVASTTTATSIANGNEGGIASSSTTNGVESGSVAVSTPAPSSSTKLSVADRAYHPDEIFRSNGELKVDIEWYLTQQILPPISRLCEPIEGTSAIILSQCLGLDTSR